VICKPASGASAFGRRFRFFCGDVVDPDERRVIEVIR